MASKQSEILRKELMQAARQAEWPTVRSEGFETRVMARLAARRAPQPALDLMGWAAVRLVPGLALILLVLTGVSLVPQPQDWTSLVSVASYLILGGGL